MKHDGGGLITADYVNPCSRTLVAAGWAEWLGGEAFDIFLTATSSKRTHPEAMLKRVKYIIKQKNIEMFGKNFMRRNAGFISGVISIERHKSGNPHSHSLLRFPGFDASNFDRKGFEDFARGTGGFCRVDIPRDQSHVVAYCTKYITKGGEVFLTENFVPVTPQRSLLDGQRVLMGQRVGLVQGLNQ